MPRCRFFRTAFLWLSLLLPLQSFAAMPCGQREAHDSSAAGAAAGFAVQHHCAHGAAPLHARADHGCDHGCCGAAMALTGEHGIALLPAAREVAGAVKRWPPTIALDRLDRPPRFVPA
jgi:hypothetical protein